MGHGRRFRGVKRKQKTSNEPIKYLLDKFSAEDIRKWNARKDDLLRFHWDFYNELAYQRSANTDLILNSIRGASVKSFSFEKWQRVVKYKYALDPLSTAGSMTDPGGRFNIGDIDPLKIVSFPALYIACDKSTALQEMLCQNIKDGQEQSAADMVLTNAASIASVSISAQLSNIIDLNRPEKLQGFIEIIKKFSISSRLKETAKKLGIPPPEIITTTKRLIESLLIAEWRSASMLYDIPAPSQIFGQLACFAGVEGIIYSSRFNGKECIVIFPQNFGKGSDSFVKLDDETPKGVKTTRLDYDIWGKIKRC